MKKFFCLLCVALFSVNPFPVQATTLLPDSIMTAAGRVVDYFMRTNPDVGADSYVGGKKRNSRIWTRAIFYEGLLNMYREQPREEWMTYTLDWANFHNWYSCTDSQRRHADFQCCGQAYLELYMMDTTQTQRMEHIKMRIDDMMATTKIDDWYWIDAIQMAMPLFAQLGTITGDEAYWERMYEMYAFTRNQHGGSKKGGGSPLFNTETGLWYRDYQFDPPYTDLTEPDKDCYWSRGNGWVLMALTRILQFTPESEAHRSDYIHDFNLMCRALADCQRTDGFWNVSLAAPTNFGQAGSEGPEISGTSLFVGGLAYGIRVGLLDRSDYLPVVELGWQAMRQSVHDDTGYVGYMQGTGSKPEDGGVITFDCVPDFEDFGIGCWLWGAAEVHALARQLVQEETGIHQLEVPCVGNTGVWYDMMGRRVQHPQSGRLYIRDGKIVVF